MASSTNRDSSQVSSNWIDISVLLRSGMVHWPGHIPVQVEHSHTTKRGYSRSLSSIHMTAHSGTHMDAPLHVLKNGKGINEMPLDTTVGRARVIEIHDTESIKVEELRQHKIRRRERILFKTQNSQRCWKSDTFVEDFVFISDEAAHFLADSGIRLVGIDYFSVGAFKTGSAETHRILLGADIWLIEGLDLSRVSPGNYDLICLPIKLDQSDGAPARAILRHIPGE